MNLELCFYIDSSWYGIKHLNKSQGFKYQQMPELITPQVFIQLIDKLLLENYLLFDFKYNNEIKLYFKNEENNIVISLKKLTNNHNLSNYIKVLIENYNDLLLNTSYIKELINKNKQELFNKEVKQLSREELLRLINNLSFAELRDLVSLGYTFFKTQEEINLERLLKI